MYEKVQNYCKRCLRCQFWDKRKKPSVLLPLLHMSRQPHASCNRFWVCDLWTPGELEVDKKDTVTANKYPFSYLISAVCGRCRYAIAKPLKRGDSIEVTNFIINELCKVQVPDLILTDNGSIISKGYVKDFFEAAESGLKHLREKQLIPPGPANDEVPENTQNETPNYKDFHRIPEGKHRTSSVYYPAGHSLVEKWFQSWATSLRKLLDSHPYDWANFTERLAFAHNNQKHAALGGLSPAEVHWGKMRSENEPDIFEIMDEVNEKDVKRPGLIREFNEQSKEARRIVDESMKDYYKISDRAYEKKHHARLAKSHDYEPGMLVLTRRFSKLSKTPYFIGPLTVIEQLGRDQLLCEYLVTGQKVKRHFSHLKHFWLPINPNDPNRKFYCAQVRNLYQMHQKYPINAVDLNLPENNNLENMTEPLEFYMETDIEPDLTETFQAMDREKEFNTDKDIEKLAKAQEHGGLSDNQYGLKGSVKIVPPPTAVQQEEKDDDADTDIDKQVEFKDQVYVNNDNKLDNGNSDIKTSRVLTASDATDDVINKDKYLPKVLSAQN